jgi:hypothetical protein
METGNFMVPFPCKILFSILSKISELRSDSLTLQRSEKSLLLPTTVARSRPDSWPLQPEKFQLQT